MILPKRGEKAASEKGRTENGVRYFTCKCCGNRCAENLKRWREKKQKDKNVCLWCLEKRRNARLDAQERAEAGPYWGRWGF